MTYKIYNDDVVKWAKEYDGERFHALFCDPPYHLTSIVKRFGKKDSAPAEFGSDGVFSRSSSGFMGQVWDGGDVAFQSETWASILPVLYDGAFGMAFSASRNWHRLAVAIEDAGFIIHPTIFGWLNGQGFPKSTRVHKEGKGVFDGHRYGLQALKPAVEPIIVFQKPYKGRARDNILTTGAGVLNIDDSRISTSDEYVINRFDDGAKPFGNGAGHKYSTIHVPQSNPKNRQGVVGTDLGITNSGIDRFQEAQRAFVGKANLPGRYPSNFLMSEDVGLEQESKFFLNVSNNIDESDPIYYCAKVSMKERSAGLNEKNPHPTLKPIDLCTYLAKLLLPPEEYKNRRILVPFSGVASEMIGCVKAGWEEVVGIEFDKENGYIDIANKRLEHWSK